MTTNSKRLKVANSGSLFGSTCMLVIGIAVFSLLVRIFSCQMLDTGGDLFWVWRVCREWLEQGRPFSSPGIWDHRMLRWMLYVPMIIVQKLFGATATCYYVWPFISSTLTAVFLFLAGLRLVSKTAGLFASIIYILYPMITLHGSQFSATGTAAMCAVIAIYSLMCWRESKKWLPLAITAIMLFCGYGAKVTTLFLFPGTVLYILYSSYKGKSSFKTYKPATIFLAIFIGLFVTECLVYQKITTTPGGRFACLMKGRHGNVESRVESLGKKDTTWSGCAKSIQHYSLYFLAFRKFLSSHNTILLNFGFLLAALIFFLRIKNLYLLAFIFIPAYLMFTYATLGTFPFWRAERINQRYYTVCYAISILMFVCTAASVRNTVKLKIFNNKLEDIGINLNIGLLLCIVLFLVFAEIPYPTRNFSTVKGNVSKVVQAKESHHPILMEQGESLSKDMKYIKRYRAFYSDSKIPFYSRPQAVKLKDAQGVEKTYYILEYEKGATMKNLYLLAITGREFEWKQMPSK